MSYKVGDRISFRGDFKEPVIGSVLERTERKGGSTFSSKVHLVIAGKDGKRYIRTPQQVKLI